VFEELALIHFVKLTDNIDVTALSEMYRLIGGPLVTVCRNKSCRICYAKLL